MTTQVLEYLIAIEEEHSLTRAAERFYLSQPSLSYHLAKAEQELNVKLFQKKGRSLLPTEDGIIFFNAARAILHTEAQTRKQIEKIKQQKQRRLHLCTTKDQLNWLQKTVLAPLNQNATNIQIQLTACEEEEAFRSLEARPTDAFFLFHRDPLPAGPWKQQTLRQDTCCFAVPYEWAQRPLPPDLLPLCFLTLQETSLQNLWEKESLAAAGLHPNMICTAPDLSTIIGMINTGHSCAFLPQRVIESAKECITVNPAVPSWKIYWSICFQLPRHAEHAASLEALLSILQSILG